MLADFYIRRVSNDMKTAVQKNHLGGLILYRSLDPAKNSGTEVFKKITKISFFKSSF